MNELRNLFHASLAFHGVSPEDTTDDDYRIFLIEDQETVTRLDTPRDRAIVFLWLCEKYDLDTEHPVWVSQQLKSGFREWTIRNPNGYPAHTFAPHPASHHNSKETTYIGALADIEDTDDIDTEALRLVCNFLLC